MYIDLQGHQHTNTHDLRHVPTSSFHIVSGLSFTVICYTTNTLYSSESTSVNNSRTARWGICNHWLWRFPFFWVVTPCSLLESPIFYNITQCSPLKVNWHFGGPCRLQFRGQVQQETSVKAGSKQSLVGWLSTDYTASCPRRENLKSCYKVTGVSQSHAASVFCGSRFLQRVSNFLQGYTVSHPRRQQSSVQ
jgi:hypothetical protein